MWIFRLFFWDVLWSQQGYLQGFFFVCLRMCCDREFWKGKFLLQMQQLWFTVLFLFILGFLLVSVGLGFFFSFISVFRLRFIFRIRVRSVGAGSVRFYQVGLLDKVLFFYFQISFLYFSCRVVFVTATCIFYLESMVDIASF